MIADLVFYPAMRIPACHACATPPTPGTPRAASRPAMKSASLAFYRLQPLRTLEKIRADILALKRETEGLLEVILLDTGVEG